MNQSNDQLTEAFAALASAVAASARTAPELARMSDIDLFVLEAERRDLKRLREMLQTRFAAESARRGLTSTAALVSRENLLAGVRASVAASFLACSLKPAWVCALSVG